ncbi:MAG: DUF6434 domain-containing protein [Pseudomonadota bacterium]
MQAAPSEMRPPISANMDAGEFRRWYWPVAELQAFCALLGVSSSGRKSDLRDRVAAALGGEQLPAATAPRKPSKASIDWSRAELNDDTIITETITFGKNVRGYFKRKIGKGFVCHSDFMAWVRSNPGEKLCVAADAWHALEARKNDPAFRREIAECNNYLNYLRDIRDANPTLSHDEARRCWDAKKLRPAQDGIVTYEQGDLAFLD